MLDAETAQRGYLLTGRSEYLQPYERALKDIDDAFDLLERYYAGEPQSLALLARLRSQTDAKLSELALTIRLHQQGESATRDITLSDIGKEQMEGIRALSAELLTLETQRVAAGRERPLSHLAAQPHRHCRA